MKNVKFTKKKKNNNNKKSLYITYHQVNNHLWANFLLLNMSSLWHITYCTLHNPKKKFQLKATWLINRNLPSDNNKKYHLKRNQNYRRFFSGPFFFFLFCCCCSRCCWYEKRSTPLLNIFLLKPFIVVDSTRNAADFMVCFFGLSLRHSRFISESDEDKKKDRKKRLLKCDGDLVKCVCTINGAHITVH